MAVDRSTKVVKAVSRAIDILEALGRADNGLRLSDLSHELSMPHPTVYRLLSTLKLKGFVAQDETTSKYYLSTRILRLQANIAKRFNLVEQAIPVLNRLVQEFHETTHLAALTGTEIVYLESRRSERYLSYYAPPGRTALAYGTALGKVLLAYLHEAELGRRFNDMELRPLSPNTITDKQELLAQLNQIRQCGYAFDYGESTPDVCCVAAPIRNQHGQVIAAISVSGPQTRLSREKLQKIAPFVVAGADEISQRMGWQPD